MQFETDNGSVSVNIDQAIVAGWTARDRAVVDHHIEELAEIGVKPPSQVPLFYKVAASLLAQSATIEVLGTDTSGEVEPMLVNIDGKLWLGVASDHTDRALEATSVALSKQICAKPVGDQLWAYDALEDHIDDIIIKSWIDEGNGWVLYQEGSIATILPLADLMAKAGGLPENTAMICGTLPAIGGVRPAAKFRMAIIDPVLKREIEWTYAINALPIID